MSLRDLAKIWQQFWFAPESPIAVSVFRILYGLVLLTHIGTQYWYDFGVFFGTNPIIPYNDYIAYWWRKDLGANIFEFVPAQDSWHIAILAFTAICIIMMILGFYTRLSIFLVYLLICSLDRQCPFLCNAGDNMQRIALFLLLFSHAGDALSLDTFIKNRGVNWCKPFFNPEICAPWAQRMLQMQMAIAYFSTGILKINSIFWFSGNGVYLATRLMDFAKFPLPDFLEHTLLDHRIPLYALCFGTVFIELALGTLIWVKELRYWVILAGILLHLGIDWLLNIPVFEFTFMSMYILFVDPNDLKKLGRWFLILFEQIKSRLTIGFSQRERT